MQSIIKYKLLNLGLKEIITNDGSSLSTPKSRFDIKTLKICKAVPTIKVPVFTYIKTINNRKLQLITEQTKIISGTFQSLLDGLLTMGNSMKLLKY